MQSDTFFPDTDSEDEDTSSESSGELPKNNNLGTLYDFPPDAVQGERFIDQSSQEKYLGIRNELFTQSTEKRRICHHTGSGGVARAHKSGTNIIVTSMSKGSSSSAGVSGDAASLTCFGYDAPTVESGIDGYSLSGYDLPAILSGASNFIAHDFSSSAKTITYTIDGTAYLITLDTNITSIDICVNIINNALYKYDSVIDLVDTYKVGAIKNIIGFELIKVAILNNNPNDYFVDLFIEEIPHKACKLNDNGLPIIDRIIMYPNTTSFYTHEPQRSYNNFFTPETFSKLTLVLRDSQNNIVHLRATYEFEATILRRSLSEK